jgi:hypothetical protein
MRTVRLVICMAMFAIHGSLIGGCSRATPIPPDQAQSVGGGVFEPPRLDVKIHDTPGAVSEDISVAFWNRGDTPLIIQRIHTTCACSMVGEVPTGSLLPGTVVKIPLQVTPPEHGEKSVTVMVETTPPSPRAKLLINAIGAPLSPPLVAEFPEQLELHSRAGKPSEALGAVITLEHAGSSPWLIGAEWKALEQPDNPQGSLRLEGPVNETIYTIPGIVRRTYRLKVTVSPTPSERRITNAVVELKSAAASRQPLPEPRVVIRHDPAIRLIPARMSWSLGNGPDERIVTAIAGEATAWRISWSDDLPRGVMVALDDASDAADNMSRKLRVRIDKSRIEPGSIVIPLTVHDEANVIETPLHIEFLP